MNFKLLLTFLISQLIEFTIYWLISINVADYFHLDNLSVFLTIVGIDIIGTVLVFWNQIPIFIANLFNRDF